MEIYKVLRLLILISLFSCKKSELADLSIVENVFIKLVTSDLVSVKYKLSQLGYQETGLFFYKKDSPNDIQKVKAIRKGDMLNVSMLGLEAHTEYVFQVFYIRHGVEKIDEQEYSVETLHETAANYALRMKKETIDYDENGYFTAELIGNDLNNLNLSELQIGLYDDPVNFDYPVLVLGNEYKLAFNGKVDPVNGNKLVVVHYQGKEIFRQAVSFSYIRERCWLSYSATNLPGNRASVFNNELYYFKIKEILKWNHQEQLLQNVGVGNSQDGITIGTFPGIQFDNSIFFSPTSKFLHQEIYTGKHFSYPQAYSYSPSNGTWSEYPFKEHLFSERSRHIHNANFFIHNGQLYLTYSLVDDATLNLAKPPVYSNYLYIFNKQTNRFDKVAELDDNLRNHHFISIDNRLYMTGLVPVYDQGFKLSLTFSVFEVNPTSVELREIYRGGSVHNPITLRPRYILEFEKKILMSISLNDFMIFDPNTSLLSKVHVRNTIGHNSLDGFFLYNGKLHITADAGAFSQKVYEMSVIKSR